jgi:hypothetical protein
LRVHAGGDISFYEDTGTTAKLTWDASEEDLKFADDSKAIFGAELEIYSDATHARIREYGSGQLKIQGDNMQLLTSDGASTYIEGNASTSAVTLYHASNSPRLVTTATGIDVTGTVTADGLLSGTSSTYEIGSSSNLWTNTWLKNGGRVYFGDTGTSIYGSSSLDILLFSTTGSNRMRIANNGDISFYEDTGTTAKFFWDASTERLGIGNAAPNTTLDITTTSNTNGFRLDVIGTAPNYMFDVRDDGTSKFRIDESGNVGIGIDSPSDVIDARQTSTGGSTQIRVYNTDNSNTTTQTAALFLSPDSRGTGALIFAEKENADFSTSAGRDISLVFSPVLNNTQTERMYITSAGNVGISTSSPAAKVHSVTTGNVPSFLAEGGLADFASPDGENMQFAHYNSGTNTVSERMRIDSSGNVGIGTTSANAILTTDPESGNFSSTYNNYDGVGLFIRGNGTSGNGNYGPALVFGSCDSDTANQDHKHSAISVVQTDTDPNQTGLAFWTHPSNTSTDALVEAMRIDASGNLLVGTTDDQPFNNSAGSTADNGLALKDNGQLQVAAYKDTANSGSVVYFNRTSTDGDIIDFRKDGTAVGSIGSSSSQMYIGYSDTGIRFTATADDIRPWNPSTGVIRDAAIDLGDSAGRFKDLYLSGGVVFDAVAGNATSNTLGDYEEGTWTPVFADATSGGNTVTSSSGIRGVYTKIGNMVTVNCSSANLDTTGMTTGNALFIQGLPFTPTSYTSPNQIYAGATQIGSVAFSTSGFVQAYALDNVTYVRLGESTNGGTLDIITVGQLTSGSADIQFTITYFTSA